MFFVVGEGSSRKGGGSVVFRRGAQGRVEVVAVAVEQL